MSHRIRGFAVILLLVLAAGLPLLGGCATSAVDRGELRRTATPPPPIPDTSTPYQTGIASWYGGKFHGRPTASGETFNKWDMTAAHRTLPLGTVLVVEHQRTGRRVKVRVNDRGPFVEGRILDLARGAARELGMVAQGTAPVHLYVVESDGDLEDTREPSDEKTYAIQVGSFENHDNARRLRARLSDRFDPVTITTAYDRYHRVRVGRFPSRDRARETLRALQDMGFETWVVLREP